MMTTQELDVFASTVVYHRSQVYDLYNALPEHQQNEATLTKYFDYAGRRSMSIYPIIEVLDSITRAKVNIENFGSGLRQAMNELADVYTESRKKFEEVNRILNSAFAIAESFRKKPRIIKKYSRIDHRFPNRFFM